MITHHSLVKILCALNILALTGIAHADLTDISTVPLTTYSAPSSTDVKPNVMFVLDDSGSMAWDFMPDFACAPAHSRVTNCGDVGQDASSARTEYLFKNAAYNGIYYNPAVRYIPPIDVSSSGTLNTTTYPSMTGAAAATGAGSASTPNWNAVKDNGFSGSATSNLEASVSPPSFFTMIPGEYCTLPNLKTCILATGPTDTHKYPAVVRWCTNASLDLATCRATFSASTTWVRAPSPPTAAITISGNNNATTVSSITVNGMEILPSATAPSMTNITFSAGNAVTVTSIKVNGVEILSATTASSNSSSTVASLVAANINNCTNAVTGACGVGGYYATANGAVVTIYNPTGSVAFTPVILYTGTLGRNTSAFALPNTPALVAQLISDSINRCTFVRAGACGIAGYAASADGAVITISAPAPTTATPTILSSGMTLSGTSFVISAIPGQNIRTSIVPSVSSYPYPGKAEKAATRTDCAGTTCTYAEEMTNYANWWTYYRTRMQLMKTAASNAFAKIDADVDLENSVSRFRLGFLSLNSGSSFLNLNEFSGSQKYNWYRKLFAANPSGGTPLRESLSKVGRLYAGKLNGETLSGATVVDPLQYSCQQNYTVLSTDGFWTDSGGTGYMLDGTTPVGNQDSNASRPYTDGTFVQAQTKISRLQQSDAYRQIRTYNLQKSVGQLQSRLNGGAWINATSCTVKTSNPNRMECQYLWGAYADTATTCTVSTIPSSNNGTVWAGNGSRCQYGAATPYSDTPSCTAVAKSTASPYTVTVAADCRNNGFTPAVDVSSCTSSSITTCSYTAFSASWINADSCVAVARSTASPYTVGVARQCQNITVGATSNTLSDISAYYYNTDLRSSLAADGTGTCTGPAPIAPATVRTNLCENNVAPNGRDVAVTQHMTTFTLGLGAQGQMIYAPTNGTDYWSDASGDFFDVSKGTTVDASTGICSWQANGQCRWPAPVQNTNSTIDDLWHAAVNGHGTYYSATDPTSLSNGLTSALATIVNTPRPGTAAAAASSNPNVSEFDNFVFSSSYKSVEWYGELVRQKLTPTGTLTPENWSAMKLLDCATTPWTANTIYKIGDNYRHDTRCYTVIANYGSIGTYDSDPDVSKRDSTNTILVNIDEDAETKVPTIAQTSRTIYTKGSAGLTPFTWAGLSTSQRAFFTTPAISFVAGTTGLSQFCSSGSNCLTATQQNAAKGEALVDFLRGDRSNEAGGATNYFRKRFHVLGDVISSEARYVKAPLFNYTDLNYKQYKADNVNRTGMVYVGSNDGMLHAFAAETGQEKWAYVPSMVLPEMYRLADKKYSEEVERHRYYVDASPETGDVCPNAPTTACRANEWKTILVGGLNRGGKGYYALDITTPESPSLLWEFTDANLGYSYGNPRITKLKTGQWVVLLSSGYNNGDGQGRLYVLDAITGVPVSSVGGGSIATGAGSADSPSGLAKISAHVREPSINNTVLAAYGGDTLGNLWRFDVNNDIGAAGYDAQLLVQFKDAANNPQSITVKPLEATINNLPVIFVGTGRYLGVTDANDATSRQTFYAVKDRLTAQTYGDPRTGSSGFVQQVITNGTCPEGAPATLCIPSQVVRTSTNNPVNWTTDSGWYVDFVAGGERSVTDPTLGLGTLLFTTISPSRTAGNACGVESLDTSASLLYALDYLTGGAVVNTGGVVAVSLGAGLATKPVFVRLANGTVKAIIRNSGSTSTSTVVYTPPIKPSSGSGTRRVSWRELTTK